MASETINAELKPGKKANMESNKRTKMASAPVATDGTAKTITTSSPPRSSNGQRTVAGKIPSFSEEADYLRAELARAGLSPGNPQCLEPGRGSTVALELLVWELTRQNEQWHEFDRLFVHIICYGWAFKAVGDELRAYAKNNDARQLRYPGLAFKDLLKRMDEKLAMRAENAFRCLADEPYSLSLRVLARSTPPCLPDSDQAMMGLDEACHHLARNGAFLAAHAQTFHDAVADRKERGGTRRLEATAKALVAYMDAFAVGLFVPAHSIYAALGFKSNGLSDSLRAYRAAIPRLEFVSLWASTPSEEVD